MNQCLNPQLCSLFARCQNCIQSKGRGLSQTISTSATGQINQRNLNQPKNFVGVGSKSKILPQQPKVNQVNFQLFNQNNQLLQQNQGFNANSLMNLGQQSNQILQQLNVQNNQQQLQLYNFNNPSVQFQGDLVPNHQFSVSNNPQLLTYLFRMGFQIILQNVGEFSQYMVSGFLYNNQRICSSANANFNNFNVIPPLQFENPTKIQQFFHCLNIFASQTYFICQEQIVQHCLLSLKQAGQVENALLYNDLFDIDNFLGGVHRDNFDQFRLTKFDSKSFYQMVSPHELNCDILAYLTQIRYSPVLIQTFGKSQKEFIVVKRINRNWYFFNQYSEIFQITQNSNYSIPDMNRQIQEINQREFIDTYLGNINVFYRLQLYPHNDRVTDITVLQILQQLYENRTYPNITFSQELLHIYGQNILNQEDQERRLIQLGELKYITEENQIQTHTYSKYKSQKRKYAITKGKKKSNKAPYLSSDSSTQESHASSGVQTRGQFNEQQMRLNNIPGRR